LTESSAAPAAVDAEARYALFADRVVVEKSGDVREIRLDDPADPAFLRLPRVDLDDGRALRRAAFDAWTANVRAAVLGGREFETSYRAPRPIATALAIGGASGVSLLCAALLWSWAFRPEGPVVVQPTMGESFVLLVSVVVVVSIIVLALAALVRAWRCRRGSYARLGAYGLRTSQGGRPVPLNAIAAVDWHAPVRCTRIEFMDGRPDLWVPAETGATKRLDLLVSAMDDRLAATARAAL
jgi:hypothetical protein